MRKIKSSGRTNSARSWPCAAMTCDYFDVTSLGQPPANTGTATKFLPSPKASLIFGPWAKTEFYVQGGFSFHSNDGRGATQTVEPVSPDYPFPNTPVRRIPALVQTKGAEIGVRTLVVPHLQSTLSLWYLHSNSELQQDGDTGGTVASVEPSNRYGVEWANYYTPLEHLAFDFDLADSRARFTTIDADDAAPGSPGGKLRARSGWVGDFIGRHTARLQRLFGEFAPALLWPARFDVRRNLSLKFNGVAQRGGRLSNQQEMARFGRIFEFA